MAPINSISLKAELRKEVKKATKALSQQQRTAKSEALCAELKYCIAVLKPAVLALFSPLPDEIDISSLLHYFSCRILLPRIADDGVGMDFYDYSPDEIKVGAYGISEPQNGVACRASEIDVMVVPGVAFSPDGARLGRGKGYYDRYMSQPDFRAYTIGVCYEHQIYDELPVEPHDCRVDRVICR